jgi:aspartate aminotransferase
MILSRKLDVIKPSPTIAVSTKAKELKAEGKDVIGLGSGEPDFDTALNVKKAAIDAINRGETKYTAVDGIPELKKAIQDKFQRDNGISYELSEISVGTGGKQVLYNALMASVNDGDEVIIPAPFWVSYPDIVLLSGGVPVLVECGLDDNFKINAQKLEKAITPKTKWLILNSPSNPTGMGYSEQELLDLIEVLKRHEHVNILSDDIYEHLTYDDYKFNTILTLAPEFKERVLTMNGVSKAYSMTGWRIGYAGGPKTLIKAMAKLQSQSTSNPCSIAQYAALEALNGPQDYIEDWKISFCERRDFVLSEFNKIPGVKAIKPQGAFYIFASIEGLLGKKTKSGKTIKNCNDFAAYLLEDYLVALVPGIAFGLENFFRVSYATSMEALEKASERISEAVKNLS